jgi:two-component system NtrC family sensor kinase
MTITGKAEKAAYTQEKMASIGQLSAGIMHEIIQSLGFVQSNTETLKKYINKMGALYELLVDINNSADYKNLKDMKAIALN